MLKVPQAEHKQNNESGGLLVGVCKAKLAQALLPHLEHIVQAQVAVRSRLGHHLAHVRCKGAAEGRTPALSICSSSKLKL